MRKLLRMTHEERARLRLLRDAGEWLYVRVATALGRTPAGQPPRCEWHTPVLLPGRVLDCVTAEEERTQTLLDALRPFAAFADAAREAGGSLPDESFACTIKLGARVIGITWTQLRAARAAVDDVTGGGR